MGKYWRLMAHYQGEDVAVYAACAGAVAPSPYTPPENATLIGLRTTEGSAALTTVTTQVQFRLTCTSFKPNSLEVGLAGSGLHTAPRGPAAENNWLVEQEVKAGVPITIEARVLGAYVNVTNEVFLWGLFES